MTSRFRIRPDPPVAGKSLEVTYIGPASEVEVQVDGKKPVKYRPDANGRFEIAVIPGGSELMLSDRQGLRGYLHRKITHTG